MCTDIVWNNYNPLSHTVILRFLELQVTYISIMVGTCTISIQLGEMCKQSYCMLRQTAIELFAPPYFHDLGRTSVIPTAFLHSSP
jgi:hypothetical protein